MGESIISTDFLADKSNFQQPNAQNSGSSKARVLLQISQHACTRTAHVSSCTQVSLACSVRHASGSSCGKEGGGSVRGASSRSALGSRAGAGRGVHNPSFSRGQGGRVVYSQVRFLESLAEQFRPSSAGPWLRVLALHQQHPGICRKCRRPDSTANPSQDRSRREAHRAPQQLLTLSGLRAPVLLTGPAEGPSFLGLGCLSPHQTRGSAPWCLHPETWPQIECSPQFPRGQPEPGVGAHDSA